MARLTTDTGPFAIVPEWLLASEVSDRAVRMYALFARYADGDGWSFPSRRALATQLRCSMSSVARTLVELEQVGALEIHERYTDAGERTTSLYRLLRATPMSLVTPPRITGDTQNESHLTRGEEAKASSRKRDELWDSLVDEMGEPDTKTERGRYNAAHKELRDISASPDDVRVRCRMYRRLWPGISLTPQALTGNWSLLGLHAKPKETKSIEEVLGLPVEVDAEDNLKRARALAKDAA